MSEETKRVAVLGGGVAGAAAALALARAGAAVELVEKDDFLGGHAASLACKALDSCQECHGCLAERELAGLVAHPAVTIHRRATLAGVARQGGEFSLTLDQRPAVLDPGLCILCGRCQEVCPEPGALRAAPWPADPVRLALDPAACLFYRDGRSALCQDLCPEEALDFTRPAARRELAVQAVVAATGFTPFPAERLTRLGYGQVPNVITALELEQTLRRQGRVARPSDGAAPRRVAFIQCVGSRDRRGHNYCSRVCCGYALRLARLLAGRHGVEVTVFYMDIQSFGHAPDELLAAARQELNLVRCLPADVLPGPGGTVRVVYQADPGQEATEAVCDLLVLSVGLTPPSDHGQLAGLLGLELDAHGFLRAAPQAGVFLAGTAGGPGDVAESVASGGRAAQEVLAYLREAWPAAGAEAGPAAPDLLGGEDCCA
ncbi:MAG: FAD-dependent oxidoreductase [Deltaproteobacteria bacterium]|nr:FAD-dependent oxidoreductase [Deltaproteobacteria bacterium]